MGRSIGEANNDLGLKVKFVAYKNGYLFRSNDNSNYENIVIQASVGDFGVSNLNRQIIYTIPLKSSEILPDTSSGEINCVFWDEIEQKWSTNGMLTYYDYENKSVTCFSSHLTSFSVLLDLSPGSARRTAGPKIFSIVTYFGCCLSIFGLIMTLITYTLFRCLTRDANGKILVNLCFSLLFLNVSFLIGSHRGIITSIDSCFMAAIFIHYFVLTSLSWMLVEAIHIHHLLVYVFKSGESHFMLKRFILAWLLPLIWVLITFSIKPGAYNSKE